MANVTTTSWLSRLGQYPARLVEAAVAMNDNDIPRAEFLLREHLKERPFEVAAIRMLAEVAGRIGRYKDSESLLRRALELSPGFTAARANLALVLYRQNRPTEAIEQLGQVLTEEPDNPGHANLQAAALGRIGEFDEAIGFYERVLQQAPNQPRVWMSFGHMLKTVGRLDEGIAAYRKAIDLMPGLGEVWWSLANLKTVKFSDADIAAMEAALAGGKTSSPPRGGGAQKAAVQWPRKTASTSTLRWVRRSRIAARPTRRSLTMRRATPCAKPSSITMPMKPRGWWTG